MRTLEALKKVAAKVTGKQESQVTGSTVDEVIEFMNTNLSITANAVVLKDSAGAIYDVTVSTAGALVVTKRV